MKKGKITTAQIQMPVFDTTYETEMYVTEKVREAAGKGADIVMLPEIFCCPYDSAEFPRFAESDKGYTKDYCSRLAAENGVYLAAGSIPELENAADENEENGSGGSGRIYNTAYVFDRNGNEIAKHRKMHLFDIDVKGGQRFMESETLSPGSEITVFDTDFGRAGLCICYDIRFPELARLMTLKGAEIILVPAAFNMTTGPAHWELTLRAQAMFNQVYVLGTSTARDMNRSYHAWGHTLLADPWGRKLGELDEKEGMLISEIDLAAEVDIREQLPLLKHRRRDIYELVEK